MNHEIKYAIQYESVKDEISSEKELFYFKKIKESANQYRLELSDEDFKRLLKMAVSDKDYNWILHQMSVYDKTLVDALIGYITY